MKIQGYGLLFLKLTLFLCFCLLMKKIDGVHPEQKIQIKLEIDTNPPISHLAFESKLVKNPVPFYVVTYSRPDLFAGKMHAALCRSWQKRVKGRDWYDVVWYIQNATPLHFAHLKDRMLQTGHIQRHQKFEKNELMELIHSKINEIDREAAKLDVSTFIADKRKLDIWSTSFFQDLIMDIELV